MMNNFVNTIDVLGDEAVAAAIMNKTITEFHDDLITAVGYRAFYECNALKSVNLPKAQTIGYESFNKCSSLEELYAPSVTTIVGNSLASCGKITTLILRSNTVCTLMSTAAFQNTPFSHNGIGGTVYVPAALIESYQTATNWSTLYAAGTCNFVAIEGSEYE